MIYNSKSMSEKYFPPILGNGDLTFSVDCQGAVNHTANFFGSVQGFEGVIYRAGRRAIRNYKSDADIISFGRLWFDAGSDVLDFDQELVTKEGIVNSICRYHNGDVIQTQAFIHPELPIYCVKKTLITDKPVNCSWKYSLCGYNGITNEAIREKKINGEKLSFVIDGNDVYRGEVCLHLDEKHDISGDEDIVLPERSRSRKRHG